MVKADTMKISILAPDLSHNCLARAYLLARVLQRRYEVEIVGPAFQGTIWQPLANQTEVELKLVPGYPLFYKGLSQIRAMQNKMTGEVIYASKPLLTNCGAALLEKLSHKRPVILDIDDWQMGFQKEILKGLSLIGKLKRFAASTLCFNSPGSYWNNFLGERLVDFADAVTVSNNFLRDKFGGTIVWHGRDTTALDPDKFDRFRLRAKFGITKRQKVVMFLGSPRPYKGVEDLIEAINMVDNNDILLMLVGLSKDTYCESLELMARERLGMERVRFLGLQPIKKVPELLSLSDLVVIPQRKSFATIGQVPAKVFDAMSMAKPIISTRVSDLPEILDGCGWIVEPEEPEELAQAIRYVFDHPEESEEKGWRARKKCIEKYSWDAMERTLVGIFAKYE